MAITHARAKRAEFNEAIMSMTSRLVLAAAMLSAGFAGAARAAESPLGVWFDDTGRGAVEIVECGKGKLCGKLVWLQNAKSSKACGTAIIGDVGKAGESWDGGWIYSPEKDNKYDVELTPLGNGKLKVLGYAGTKLFSKEMTWTRAPADIQRCDQQVEAKAAPAPTATGTMAAAAAPLSTDATRPPAAANPVETATATPPPPRTAGAKSAMATPASPTTPALTSKTEADKLAAAPDGKRVRTAQAEVQANADKPVADAATAEKPRAKTVSRKKKMCRVDAPFVTVEFRCNDDDD